MENGAIKFKGDDDWLVVNLYRFLHYLNVFYNRLYVLDKYTKEHPDVKLSPDDFSKFSREAMKYVEKHF